MAKKSNKNNKKDNKYNAENEIIIGVTTKPREKVRVESQKSTRTNVKKEKDLKSKKTNNKKIPNKNNRKSHKQGQAKVKKVINENLVKEKEIRKLNRKRLVISICILLFIVLCGIIYYLTTPVFNVSNIQVYGNEKNSVDTYISLSGVDIGTTNIFAISNANIIKSIKESPYVDSVIIKRKLPNTIELHITERNVDYQIEYSSKYMYINNQGYLLEISEDIKDVLIIKGLSLIADSIQVGQRVNNQDLSKLNTVLKIINYCKYNSIENKITIIDVSDISNYTLVFGEEGKKAYLGDASSLSERILWLKTILQQEKNNKGEIFINGDLNKDKVYFRKVN